MRKEYWSDEDKLCRWGKLTKLYRVPETKEKQEEMRSKRGAFAMWCVEKVWITLWTLRGSNRTDRLEHLISLKAPKVIIQNECRMIGDALSDATKIYRLLGKIIDKEAIRKFIGGPVLGIKISTHEWYNRIWRRLRTEVKARAKAGDEPFVRMDKKRLRDILFLFLRYYYRVPYNKTIACGVSSWTKYGSRANMDWWKFYRDKIGDSEFVLTLDEGSVIEHVRVISERRRADNE